MKKLLCILLCFLMIIPVGFAAHAEDGTMKFIAYNVSGIPVVGDFQGNVFTTTAKRAKLIGELLNTTDVDFIGVEEDFNGHKYLAEQMSNYPYRSYTSGGLAMGQGLNVFSKHPLYNIDRQKWRMEYGSLSGSMDALSNKGFVYALMEYAPGVFVDVITVHMDAGYDALSVRCRADNFKQLAEYINKNLDGERALVVLGDFNFKFKRRLKDDLATNLLEPAGLQDVWSVLFNGGLTDPDDPTWNNADGDDLDRVLFRSGSSMTLTPVSRTVPELLGENGERYTDHNPMKVEFEYEITGGFTAPELSKPAEENEALMTFKEIGYTFVRIIQMILGVLELPYLAYQGVVEIVNGGKMP